jgi:hypothetical protein
MLAVHAVNLLQPAWPQRLIGRNYNKGNPSHLLCFATVGSEMVSNKRVPTLDWPSDLFVDVDATADDVRVDSDLRMKTVLSASESVLSASQVGLRVTGETTRGSMTRPYYLVHGTMQAEITT